MTTTTTPATGPRAARGFEYDYAQEFLLERYRDAADEAKRLGDGAEAPKLTGRLAQYVCARAAHQNALTQRVCGAAAKVADELRALWANDDFAEPEGQAWDSWTTRAARVARRVAAVVMMSPPADEPLNDAAVALRSAADAPGVSPRVTGPAYAVVREVGYLRLVGSDTNRARHYRRGAILGALSAFDDARHNPATWATV